MKSSVLKSEILLSWRRCMDQRLPCSIAEPVWALRGDILERGLEERRALLGIFEAAVGEIGELVMADHLMLLLTDAQGSLLADYRGSKVPLEENRWVKPGVFFTEESLGTNAISLALRLRCAVGLDPEQNYCDLLKKWSCYALPLGMEDIVGYLAICSVGCPVKKELIAIMTLLRHRINSDLKDKTRDNDEMDPRVKLTGAQQRILSLISRGLTDREIANELWISVNTVKYHKRQIFLRLRVKNCREAVAMAVRLDLAAGDSLNIVPTRKDSIKLSSS